jgi:hypothetical protein
MFANDISLNPTSFGGTNAAKVYSLVGWGGDSSSLRRVSATAASNPETLTISHRESKDGAITTDQHLVRLDESIVDPLLGRVVFSAWLVVRVPRGTSVITLAKIKDIVGRLIAFEQASNAIDQILNSEP